MRVLLVEDEKGLGQAIKEHVADEGHAVDWFMTLADASASLATTQYDLILLDLMLPDGRGIDVFKNPSTIWGAGWRDYSDGVGSNF